MEGDARQAIIDDISRDHKLSHEIEIAEISPVVDVRGLPEGSWGGQMEAPETCIAYGPLEGLIRPCSMKSTYLQNPGAKFSLLPKVLPRSFKVALTYRRNRTSPLPRALDSCIWLATLTNDRQTH
ncbi:hypothetical protein AVEN_186211-1 [Araneus ventricosus]|uniref:Uncharacterized protein n=1 Tax=Araneus ventricosus TaxID=182803 RepID=A0A4Y2TGA5_ARAVE|nr:hypothetical protein AVEN_186211-1 [Araneus ventricosus]